jgi:hypothetical protein
MIRSLSSARSGFLTERQRCYYPRRTQSGCELTTTVGLGCLVAGHCWDPVGQAIVDYSYYLESLPASLWGEG